MALTQRLELRQGQSLVRTRQLQQAIKLLQLSNLELAEYVEAEIEKNPLLERGEPEPATNGEDRQPESGPASDEPLESALAREDFSKAEDLDADKSDVYAEDAPAGPVRDSQLSDWTSLRSHTSIDA